MKRTKAARVSTMRRLLAGITATALLSAQTERAFACQTQAFNVAGQTIRLTVTFFTNDPNEDGEGEPVLISSSGGFFVQQDSHVQMTYDVVSTVDNEVFTGTFGGEAPDGDESCSLSTDTQKRNMLTPDQKRVLNDVINDLVLSGASTTAICAVTCPLVPPFTPVCVGMCVITVFGDALLAWRLRRMVNDPADPNFMVFAMPSFTMLTC